MIPSQQKHPKNIAQKKKLASKQARKKRKKRDINRKLENSNNANELAASYKT